ncbi:L10-interacting MYB domain-containing protein-like [Cornus florida]|uniref:L10-interacting MYB domain-containing protein-like n=1 Tax=Cornus florida TaxID=4283 RepID=UPI00289DDD71|nr:L10-interacting MYB domain-containing protein-like [Cornus florida]
MLMEEEKTKGNRKTTTFYPKGWKAIEEGMKRLIGREYTRQQLRNKFYQLRDRYKSYEIFLFNIGSSWDSKSGQVTLTEAQWEKMDKKVKNARRLRRKGCKHYDLLSDLFDDTSATSAGAHSSAKRTSTSLGDDDKDKTGIKALMAVLNGMEGLDNDRYFKAAHMFIEDVLWRKMFLGLDDDRKGALIWSL